MSSPVHSPVRPPQLILVGGGVRSGKSRFALELAAGLGPKRVFIATAEGLDAEMATRIARHRAERPATFTTIEEPVALPECLARQWDGPAPPDAIVVDCLTLWVSNLLVRGGSEASVATRFGDLAGRLRARRGHVILVSNEVGMGLVPDTAIGRAFRDRVGQLHQALAAEADQIFVGMMGLIVRVAPPPVERVFLPEAPGARHDVRGDE